MKVAVLGGGAVAHATAADLSLAGHEIRLAEVPEFAENIAAVQALGGIHLSGVAPSGGTPGFVRIPMVTTEIPEAVRGAELVMVVVPAYAHEVFMRALVPCVERGQLVVFSSGYYASLVFAKMLSDTGREGEVLIGETTSTVYMTRMRGPGRVWIKAGKKRMPFSALPASKTTEALRRINLAYPQLVPAQNVFETSMTEPGTIVHPTTTLMNASRIEQIGPYMSVDLDMTPSIARVMDAVDQERITLQRALGLRGFSLPDIFFEYFGSRGANCYEATRARPIDHGNQSPGTLKHRYITEDVPYGLVPAASIGALVGIEALAMRALIQLASIANEEDYWTNGRTAERMGLSGMQCEELTRYVA